jgi:hypothetical protein
MKLIELRAENFKRLKAVTIHPSGAVTPIVGRNGAGKTSVLDAITAALGGLGYSPELPIRIGEDHAEVIADLGDIKVRRRWTAKGSTLEVSTPEGAKYPSPQAVLDKVVGQLGFDPLSFGRLPSGQQALTLAKIAGLDLEAHEAKRRAVFDERTAVNREHKTASAQLAAMPMIEAPEQEVSIDAIADRLQGANTHNVGRERAIAEVNRITGLHTQAAAKVERLKRELAAAEADELRGRDALAKAKAAAEQIGEAVNLDHLRREFSEAESVNAKVRQRKARVAKAADVEAIKAKADALTVRIEAIDSEKAEAIASAKLPVPGLAIGENGVTLKGIPLSQCSGAERLRVSVAIGLALNPKLKLMLIRDGSLLDADGMALLAEMAGAAGAQVLIERVDNGSEVGVMIEDGEVVEGGAA